MISILFLIPTLDRGGAENVLVNLVNHMDQSKFRITVQTLFDKDSQKDRLRPGIEYRSFLYKQFHGNSRLQARLPAKMLYWLIVGKRYDIVVSYLEGPTAHILSGCPFKDTKKVAWFHSALDSDRRLAAGFVSKVAAVCAYLQYDCTVYVAETAQNKIEELAGTVFPNPKVLYNTLNVEQIREKAHEGKAEEAFSKKEINLVSVGKLDPVKGYDRLARVHKRLRTEGYPCQVYLIGEGAERSTLEQYISENGLNTSFHLIGFLENPYPYVAMADLFVCSSRREGFSTAATEALILGTPVCTTDVSGMREMLGDNEYGLITENSEEALYCGIKRLLDDPALLAHYREKAKERGQHFETDNTVRAVEEMLLELYDGS